ncbi:hypothetical protein Hanom_Chr14g01307331 [Helianthus anomalus]
MTDYTCFDYKFITACHNLKSLVYVYLHLVAKWSSWMGLGMGVTPQPMAETSG